MPLLLTMSMCEPVPTTQGNVEYVAVRAGKDECATPAKLVQNYVVCRLDKKLDVLLGFIKTHLKSKMIVFFTSCAQVCGFVSASVFFCASPGSDFVPVGALGRYLLSKGLGLIVCAR